MLQIKYAIMQKPFLIALFLINFFGSIYGFIWYESQIAVTPLKFLAFVPDSPTATMFFTIVLFFFIFGRRIPYIEALAVTTLFKYGVWAVVMNILLFVVNGEFSPAGVMLMLSHGGMAIQGLLYIPHYTFKLRHLTVAGIFLLHNEIIDYVFEMMPIYSDLTQYMKQIGYFTFWLSVITIIMVYFLTIHKQEEKLK